MALTENDVSRLANLARLELTSDARAHIQNDLNSILSLIEKLQAVDTTGVEPLTHPISTIEAVTLRLREDRVTENASIEQRDALLNAAPATQEGLFLVPKVIE